MLNVSQRLTCNESFPTVSRFVSVNELIERAIRDDEETITATVSHVSWARLPLFRRTR
jgi:hypothetical protein